jgi:hypothetical protein
MQLNSSKPETIRLNIEKFAAQVYFNNELIQDYPYSLEVQSILVSELEAVALRIQTYVACSSEKIIKINSPATAWQHIKQDYAPKWFLKKYPVEI